MHILHAITPIHQILIYYGDIMHRSEPRIGTVPLWEQTPSNPHTGEGGATMRWLLMMALAVTIALLWGACDDGGDHTTPPTGKDLSVDVWSADAAKADDPTSPPPDTTGGEDTYQVPPDTSDPTEECPPSILDEHEVCYAENCILERMPYPDCGFACYKFGRLSWIEDASNVEDYCMGTSGPFGSE